MDRSAITRAVGEIRPLLADRSCRIEGGLRLRTLADVITHRGATGQVVTPPRKRRGKHLEHLQRLMAHHEAARFAHSSAGIPVEHGIAHLKNGRALARHHTRRSLPDTIRAVAGLLTDEQATHHTKELALATTPA
ncbi:hypothetical protein [Streptomyces sp. NPDC002403]